MVIKHAPRLKMLIATSSVSVLVFVFVLNNTYRNTIVKGSETLPVKSELR